MLAGRSGTGAGIFHPFPRPLPAMAMAPLLLALSIPACSNGTDTAAPLPVVAPKGELAFPGATGFGATAKGGRDGRIIPVTSLDDSGAGTLRACISATGPRICIFRVAGLIRFTGHPPFIRNPYLTIAGETAPGGGITIAHGGGDRGMTPIVIKNTHDIVIRHIRVRPDRIGRNPEAEDAFTIEGSHDIILDHVSGSWARDEVFNSYADNNNLTVSNSIFAEGIPRHDKCALLGSDVTRPQRLSFIGNICAHNGDRNPDINFTPGSCIEIINNIFYDAQSQFAEIWSSYGGSPVSLIGNHFRKGPSTADHAVGIDVETIGATGEPQIFLRDNEFVGDFVHQSPLIKQYRVDIPACPLTTNPLPVAEAYQRALAGAGAFPRDAIDRRIVMQVRDRTGRIVKRPGTIPAIAPATPYPDDDGDGMDDRWERDNGANPSRFDAWDVHGGGLRHLDAFLDHMHRQKMAGGA